MSLFKPKRNPANEPATVTACQADYAAHTSERQADATTQRALARASAADKARAWRGRKKRA